MNEEKPAVPYWHLWTDERGVSRQSRCAMTAFDLKSMSPPAGPQWQGAKTHAPTTVFVTVQPVGWIGTWHENPKPQWIVPLSGPLVRRVDGRPAGRDGAGRDLVRRRPGYDRRRRSKGSLVRHRRRPAGRADDRAVRGNAPELAMSLRLMDGFDIVDRRFARYLHGNAPLERLATGFRWIEGLVWWGDANCLLFQDIPNDRTMRWSEGVGVTVHRSPSRFANGQTRDRQGRLIACSHRDRCLVRTEYDGTLTTLVDAHDGRRLNAPNDVVVKSDGSIWFQRPAVRHLERLRGRPPAERAAAGPLSIRSGERRHSRDGVRLRRPERPRVLARRIAPVRVRDRRPDARRSGADDPGVRRLAGRPVADRWGRVPQGRARLCDGIKVDSEGNLWTSAGDGVHCIDPSGALLGKVLVPSTVASLCFGDRHASRLFIGASHTLYAIFLNRRGVRFP